MKELKLRISLVCAILLCLPAAAAAQVTGEREEAPPEADIGEMLRQGDGVKEQTVRDMDIVSDIQKAYLREKTLNPATIDIRSEDGHVHLSGTAPSQEARDLAVEIAGGIENVADVASDIKVRDTG